MLAVLLLALLLAAKVRSSPAFALESNYARVQVGMTREEVREILGHEPLTLISGWQPGTDFWLVDCPTEDLWLVRVDYDSTCTRDGERVLCLKSKVIRTPESPLARLAGYLDL